MSFSDLYSTGFRERNRDHFASIVRVALSDGEINPEEKAFLDRLARNLEISAELYQEVLKNPKAFPINPPVSAEARIERLYDITRMVYVDHIEDQEEISIMKRLCIGLGFNAKNIQAITEKALQLIHEKADLERFQQEIKAVDSILN